MGDTILVNGRQVDRNSIKGLECVFATYTQNRFLKSDLLVVKENVWYKDGTVEPNLRMIKDKKWPFYITKEGAARNHETKKEWEDLSKLNRFMSTRVNLAQNLANALGYGHGLPLRNLKDSPYVYGVDVTPGSLIKELYQRRSPECNTVTYNVAGLDTETDVIHGHGEVIISNITYKDRAYTAITEEYVGGIPHDQFIQRCRDKAEHYLGDDFRKRNLKWEIEIVANAGIACKRTLDKAHEYQPDFVSIWNMNYDLPRIQADLEKYGFDCNQVFSDPRVPKEYRFYDYKEGPAIKVTQDGSKSSLHPAERWHVATHPATFYFVDSMCLYKRIRTAGGNEDSYKLDDILRNNKLDSKLKIPELEHLEEDGDAWHKEMQTNYKAEYVVYNLKDDLSLEDLDARTGDICRAFNTLAGLSELGVFNKNPRRIVDDMHYFVQQHGKIMGSTPSDIAGDPLNKHLLPLGGWIKTLASYLINAGMYAFEDAKNLQSMIYRYLADQT